MFATYRYARVLACVAAFGMLISPLLGAQPVGKPAISGVFNVKLAEGGKLIGQVVNAAGNPQAGVRVIVASKKTASVAETRTDELGRFSLVLPESGVYRVAVSDRLFTIRAWEAELAPPTSRMGLLCVTDDVVRGKFNRQSRLADSHPHLVSLLTNPVVIGLGVASAIALPIALDDNDDPATGGEGLRSLADGEPAS